MSCERCLARSRSAISPAADPGPVARAAVARRRRQARLRHHPGSPRSARTARCRSARHAVYHAEAPARRRASSVESGERPDPRLDDERRRYYRLHAIRPRGRDRRDPSPRGGRLAGRGRSISSAPRPAVASIRSARAIALNGLHIEPWTVGATAAILLLVVAGACWVQPAARPRIHPAITLRAE